MADAEGASASILQIELVILTSIREPKIYILRGSDGDRKRGSDGDRKRGSDGDHKRRSDGDRRRGSDGDRRHSPPM